MTGHIAEIRDALLSDNEFSDIDSLHSNTFVPSSETIDISEKEYDRLCHDAIPASQVFHFKKGDKVTIKEYGLCVFKGFYDGKCALFPTETVDLSSSPYFVDAAEPYLLIPLKRIKGFLA